MFLVLDGSLSRTKYFYIVNLLNGSGQKVNVGQVMTPIGYTIYQD